MDLYKIEKLTNEIFNDINKIDDLIDEFDYSEISENGKRHLQAIFKYIMKVIDIIYPSIDEMDCKIIKLRYDIKQLNFKIPLVCFQKITKKDFIK